MLIIALLLFAQNTPEPTAAAAPRITWFTQWDKAVEEAERLNRPILLQSAAPLCNGVSGMW